MTVAGWSLEPSVVGGLALLGGGYGLCVGSGRRRFVGASRPGAWRVASFYLGLAVAAVALLSPLDELSDRYLLSAHMVQHMLLTLALPPLLLFGTPGWLVRPLLRSWLVERIARLLTRPVPAFLLFNAVFAVSHFPVIYNLGLADEHIHAVEHLVYIGFALLTWWPILSPLDELPRLNYPVQMLYLFLQTLPGSLVGAMISLSDGVLYPVYAAAPRVTWLSPLEDQQLAGLIMWLGSTALFFVALSTVFFLWAQRENRQAIRPAHG